MTRLTATLMTGNPDRILERVRVHFSAEILTAKLRAKIDQNQEDKIWASACQYSRDCVEGLKQRKAA